MFGLEGVNSDGLSKNISLVYAARSVGNRNGFWVFSIAVECCSSVFENNGILLSLAQNSIKIR